MRKIFGEYASDCDGKGVALVCDNQVFVRPTAAGRALLGRVNEAPPYPGAGSHWLVDEPLDDAGLMPALAPLTAEALAAPRPKRPPR